MAHEPLAALKVAARVPAFDVRENGCQWTVASSEAASMRAAPKRAVLLFTRRMLLLESLCFIAKMVGIRNLL
jgi:hypothetical protein